MAEEIERDYESDDEFERDRRRLFGEGGWLVRWRGERTRGVDFPIVDVPDLPGALGCVALLVVGLITLVWFVARRKHRSTFRVAYEREESG